MGRPFCRSGLCACAALAVWMLATPVDADAADASDVLDAIEADLRTFEIDANNLQQRLTVRGKPDLDKASDRHLVAAQVAYGVGNWADATVLLYDIVEKRQGTRAYPDAVFYLADSLFHRRDHVSARKYFRIIISELGEASPHYQKSLERLLELSLVNGDPDIDEYLRRIDVIPEANLLESVPYVRGKYEYFRGEFDAALRALGNVRKGSSLEFQAQYMTGAVYLQKGDLASAANVFHGLLALPLGQKVELQTKQKRIQELTHLALGRIHYKYAQDASDPRKQEEEAAEAISHYLMVPRRSDLFDDALHEIAFVYVQGKKLDKALRALELVEMASGTSCDALQRGREQPAGAPKTYMMPDVCILKGNLQMRKAQVLSGAGNPDSPIVYASAMGIFASTRDAYMKPRDELRAILERRDDPKKFFAQVIRPPDGDEPAATDVVLPDLAVRWVREQLSVTRVIDLTTELAGLRRSFAEARVDLERLEHTVTSPSRAGLDRDLMQQRTRIRELLDELSRRRHLLVDQESKLAVRLGGEASVARAGERRRKATGHLSGLPGSGDRFSDRVKKARARYEALEIQVQEIDVFIGGLEAEVRGVEKYHADSRDQQKMPREVYEQTRADLRQLIRDLRSELQKVQRDLRVATDAAGIDDELARETELARRELDAAVAEEHALLREALSRGDRAADARVNRVDRAFKQMDLIERSLIAANSGIDTIIDTELADERAAILQEKDRLDELWKELETLEVDNVGLGSEIIYASFEDVAKSFYEVTVRADVGVIDIGWAQKEETEGFYNQVNLESRREKIMLENEFPEMTEAGREGQP